MYLEAVVHGGQFETDYAGIPYLMMLIVSVNMALGETIL
jgi:hypothetical protein